MGLVFFWCGIVQRKDTLLLLQQEQYLEEGIEWDTVEVEFNESLINCLHQVCVS